ncbi:hypothetical protein OU994_08475 [Pseudoduganella sp. SL102]|uniref:hypothetical protein n=1 Tax=Pseudoduganella sp. SL102 TaxID=2995154 RepID=UPI00248ACB3F|nr:hypothetical protein [Pseudoduganella sp. SL102]WBS04298.1 hypothetical protein OU994_08475 [Pseudoduganella sp. SL102]
MTQAFENFLRQFHMTGSEKADGYSRDAFEGLADHEKTTVFDMLVQELPWASDWLFRLDPGRALAVATELEPRMRGRNSGVHWLQRQIVDLTGDLRYQQHMIEDYPGYDERARPGVIASIACTPASEAAIAFFRQVILAGEEGGAMHAAARALLRALQVPRASAQEEAHYLGLEAQLCGADRETRSAAIEALRRYGPDGTAIR